MRRGVTPDGGESRPDDGQSRPDGQPRPDGGQSRPDDGQSRPDDGQSRPDDGQSRPDGGQPRPDGGQPRPDWRVPALRCGLEVALVALITAYLWVNVTSPLVSGVVAVVGLVCGVAVLCYTVNVQVLAWVRYASAQGDRRRRRRRRQRQERRPAERSGDEGRAEPQGQDRREARPRNTGDGEPSTDG